MNNAQSTLRSPYPLARRGMALQIVLAVTTATLVGAVAVTGTNISSKRRRDPPPMSNVELDVALRRVHLGPESLAAIGLNAQQTATLVGRARAGLSGSIVGFRAADQAFADAQRELDRLERLVRAGLGTENDLAALNTARTAHAAAVAARQAQLDAVLNAGAGEGEGALSQPQLATLEIIRDNSTWDIPIQYRCRAEATEAGWVALRDALADQRIAVRQSSSPSQASQAILNEWGSDPAVNAAAINLTSLPDITSAYNNAISGPP